MIGIIVPGNRKYTPYVENYIDTLTAENAQYRIMSWNKNGIEEDNIDFSFNYKVDDFDRKRMLLGYLRFLCACRKYIRKNGIDQLIILTAAPAFFLTKAFLSKFRDRFILDIRDDSPFIRRFPKLFHEICGMAKSVVVSSGHYTEWTGRDTVLCHNADLGLLAKHKDDPVSTMNNEDPIRITYAGVMIEGDCNIRTLEQFQNDQRFEFVYIGKESPDKQKIAEYVKTHAVNNVKFEGVYTKDQIIDIYHEKADLINILRNNTQINRDAVPNKLYEAVLAGKPVLVYWHNQAIVDYVRQYHIGIVIPEQENLNLTDYLYNEYKAIDMEEYERGRKAFLDQVDKDMKSFRKAVSEFSKQGK